MFIRLMMRWTVYSAGVIAVVFIWLLTRFRKQKNDLPSRTSRDRKDKGPVGHSEQKIVKGSSEAQDKGDDCKGCEEYNSYEEDAHYEVGNTVAYNHEQVEVLGTYVKDDECFLRVHVPFLSRQELERLRSGPVLGVGGFGSVWQATYGGNEAVVKQLIDTSQLMPLLIEARVMVELNGAGGAPQLLAVCKVPPALVQEFVGHTYDEYLAACSVEDFLTSFLSIIQRVGEIHAKGYVHNDLKMNNITFTGTVCKPVFHIIDFGWACHLGQPAIQKEVKEERAAKKKANQAINDFQNYYDYLFTSDATVTVTIKDETDDSYQVIEEEYTQNAEAPWMAPEVLIGKPVMASGDVYSLGHILKLIMEKSRHTFLRRAIMKLKRMCLQFDPLCRPSLSQMTSFIEQTMQQLTQEQMSEQLLTLQDEQDE